MRKNIYTFTLLAILCSFSYVVAQESAFSSNNQQMAQLPGNVDGLSIVDGSLYCYSAKVLLVAERSKGEMLGFWADTTVARLKDNVNYVVCQPGTGDYYFTVRDDDKSVLYVFRPNDGRKGRTSKVKMGAMSVEHPCFTADGNIMIFASRHGRRGFGGSDLWYATYKKGHWSHPQNLGNRVNTRYDEQSPSMYKDCLLFSSNGQDDDHSVLNIYATRLISDEATGDTVGMVQIGRNRVQKLPEPFNGTSTDDYDMVIDTVVGCGYWVSKPLKGNTISKLYSFSGDIEGVMLWGRITDKHGQPMNGVKVSATQGEKLICSSNTDANGFYRLYLRSNELYDLKYKQEGYFVEVKTINTARTNDEYLISESRQDMVMDRLMLNEHLVYEDLFKPGVDIDLSQRGKDVLEPVVRFLNENPTMRVIFLLYSDATDDASFNNLLTQHRLSTLKEYLYEKLPSSVIMTFENGCDGRDGCTTATGLSRLITVISDSK